MAWITDSLLIDLGLCCLPLLLLLFLYLNSVYKYFEKRGIPYAKPTLIFGSFKDNLLGSQSVFDIHETIYKELKDERFGGFFEMHVPKIMIKDPELINRVLVKDFAYFHDRGVFAVDKEGDPLTNTVANQVGHEWRIMRYKMSTTFSTGKLKGMFDQIYNCGGGLLQQLDRHAQTGDPVEAKDVLSIFTVDVIASCAFGLQFDLSTPEGERFKQMVRKSIPESRFAVIILICKFLYGKFFSWFGVGGFPKDVTKYFLNLSRETVRHRRQTGARRSDFLQLLLDIQDSEQNSNALLEEEEAAEADDDAVVNQFSQSSLYNISQLKNTKVMTDECLAASSFLFLVAGAEVSTATAYVLYCLAANPEAQLKLQQEVDRVLADHGGFNYQSVKQMTYLDQVIQESWRLYPVAGMLMRQCTAPYRVPDSSAVIEQGTQVIIPVWALHRDPRHWPDPERFMPERFVDNNHRPSPTYLPFGDGPRICIAMRFALLEAKICVARVMTLFSLRLHQRTLHPLRLDPRMALVARPAGGVWLTAHRRLHA